jgi:Cu(I)-responsive transcriptional regulator
MNIGQVASASGLPAKTIRYYEEIGLVSPERGANGYRRFRNRDVHVLAFLGRARSVGFSVEECRALLALYDDGALTLSEVRSVVRRHLDEIEAKMRELESVREVLTDLDASCREGRRPDHPMLTDLAGGPRRRHAAE